MLFISVLLDKYAASKGNTEKEFKPRYDSVRDYEHTHWQREWSILSESLLSHEGGAYIYLDGLDHAIRSYRVHLYH